MAESPVTVCKYNCVKDLDVGEVILCDPNDSHPTSWLFIERNCFLAVVSGNENHEGMGRRDESSDTSNPISRRQRSKDMDSRLASPDSVPAQSGSRSSEIYIYPLR